ncbi:peptidoglycan-binding protein [Streptomyces wedmorensis]|uniref:peptidoglycan-binding protein n=1 Tax=Streptomyces wedmorensis TaxID=43759 RepID=UPI00379CEE94
MTGHVCPECGVHRPGCACAQAAIAAAEDFDPLRIRPYVTLDAPERQEGPQKPQPAAAGGAGAPYGSGAGAAGTPYGDARSPYGDAGTPHTGGGSDGDATAYLPAYAPEDPPTAQLSAIRPEGQGPLGARPGETRPDTYPATPGQDAHPGAYGAEPGQDAYPGAYEAEPGHDARLGARPAETRPNAFAGDGYPDGTYPGTVGDPSETMPLLLRGVGDVPPTHGGERARGRRRGAVVAAVAAVAVAGTAALAAAVLGGGDEGDDRAAVPEVTTSASLNVVVSEAPSLSSETPEPSASSPAPTRTSASPTPSANRTTASSAPSTTAPAAPPATAPAAPTSAPTTSSPSAQPPQQTEEAAVTLSLGATGSEVRELQLRLQALWIYDGRINGKYTREVEEAVATYQRWLYPQTDPEGVYGAFTRSHLEAATPEI